MRNVKFDPEGWGVSYSDLIETMDFREVLVEESDNDYQGSTYMLVTKFDQYGHFVYGWGSCSGCDAAQAVSTQEEADSLRDDLYFGIRWFDSAAEALEWFKNDDHKLQWYGHDDAFNKFMEQAKAVLQTHVVTPEAIAQAKVSIEEAASE